MFPLRYEMDFSNFQSSPSYSTAVISCTNDTLEIKLWWNNIYTSNKGTPKGVGMAAASPSFQMSKIEI
jgi:hypothetical protein